MPAQGLVKGKIVYRITESCLAKKNPYPRKRTTHQSSPIVNGPENSSGVRTKIFDANIVNLLRYRCRPIVYVRARIHILSAASTLAFQIQRLRGRLHTSSLGITVVAVDGLLALCHFAPFWTISISHSSSSSKLSARSGALDCCLR